MKNLKKNLCLSIVFSLIISMLPIGIRSKAADNDIYINCGKGLETFHVVYNGNDKTMGYEIDNSLKYVELDNTAVIIDGISIGNETKTIGTSIWIDNNRDGVINEGDKAVKLKEGGNDKTPLLEEKGINYYDLSDYIIIYNKEGNVTCNEGLKVTMIGGKVDTLMPSVYKGELNTDTDIKITGGYIKKLSTGGKAGEDSGTTNSYGKIFTFTKTTGDTKIFVGGNAVLEGITGGYGDFIGDRSIHITDNAQVTAYDNNNQNIGKVYGGTQGGWHEGNVDILVDGNAVVDGLFGGGYISSNDMNLVYQRQVGNIDIVVKGNARINNCIYAGGHSPTWGNVSLKILENARIESYNTNKDTKKIYMGGTGEGSNSSVIRNSVLEIDSVNIDLTGVISGDKVIIGGNVENDYSRPYSIINGATLIILSERSNAKLRDYITTNIGSNNLGKPIGSVDCIMVRPDIRTKNATVGDNVILGMKSNVIFKTIGGEDIYYKWYKDSIEINGEIDQYLKIKAEENTHKYTMEVWSKYMQDNKLLTTTEFSVTGTKQSGGGSTGGGDIGGGGSSGGGGGDIGGGSVDEPEIDIPAGDTPAGEIPKLEITEPIIKDNEDIRGWEAISKEISLCKEKGSFIVDMNKATKISAQLFKTIQEKDIEVIFELENGSKWRVYGKDIPAQEHNEVDLKMELKEYKFSEDIQNTFKGNKLYRLSFPQKSEFGFPMTMNIELKESKGKVINLFNNEKNQNLLSVGKFNSKDVGDLTIRKGSDYFVVIGENVIIENAFNKTTVNSKEKTLYAGGTTGKTFSLSVKYPEALKEAIEKGIIKASVTYGVGNKNTVSISKSGKITAKRAGNTIITTKIKLNGLTKTLKTKISVKKAYVNFNKKVNTIKKGKTYIYTAKAYGYKLSDIVWSSSNSKVVSIGKTNGKAIAKKEGTAYIKVSVKGNAKTIKVIVK